MTNPLPDDAVNRRIAEAVADALFMSGFDESADRLVLVNESRRGLPRDLGGWCKDAVVSQVLAIIHQHGEK